MHPLIALADTMPLEPDSLAKLRAAFERIKFAITMPPLSAEEYMEAIAAVLLGEYILHLRQQASTSLFPIPPAKRAPITVRAKTLK